MRHHDVGEAAQALLVGGAEIARREADEAQGADPQPRAEDQRRARIEPHLRRAGHERVRGEARVRPGVLRHEHGVALDRAAAEGDVPRRALDVEAAPRLEPRPFAVDERDQGDRDPEQVARRLADRIEVPLAVRIEDLQVVEGLEALRLGHEPHRSVAILPGNATVMAQACGFLKRGATIW
jgi:hypothetical protein